MLEAAGAIRDEEAGVGVARARPLVPALAAFAPVLGLAAAQGGYFPTAWGWASVPLFWTAAVASVARARPRLSTRERVYLAGLAALAVWIAASAAWSVGAAASVLELERFLVYVAAVAAVLLVTRVRFARYVLGGLLAAVSLIALFSLATRLVPDRVGVYDRSGVYRLAEPIGYWNGLALFTAMGALLALGFAARARTIAVRALCGALLVPLLTTFYFTFGRAAWIALAAGLAAAVAADPRRLQLLATLFTVGPGAALAVVIASRESGLTHAGTPLAQAAHDGHRLALVLVLLAVVNAAAAAALAWAGERVRPGAVVRRSFAVALAVAAVAGAGVALGWYGGPVRIAERGYEAFKAPPPHVEGNLNQRLLNFSGNGRADLWRLAWDDADRHPLLGAGAGTYERYFLAHQPQGVGRVRDAHGLYIETLAELGPLGLALLAALLAVPLVGLVPARRHPLVPAALAAYVAFLVHAGVDWDWELPAVTLVGLLCGATILLVGRRPAPREPLAVPARWAIAVTAAAAALFAGITLTGHTALSRSEAARARGDQATAATDARRARRLMPWSPAPWAELGRAQLAAGAPADARRSFRKAVSIDSGDWELWYDLATVTTGPVRKRALAHVAALYPRSGLVDAAEKTTR